jgi:penicillin-binding protein 2
MPLSNPDQRNRSFRFRLGIATVLMLLAIFAVVLRVMDLEILHFSKFRTLAYDNHVALVPVAPPRGLVLAEHGEVLAENQPTYALEITPDQVPNLQGTLQRLQQMLDLSADDMRHFQELRLGKPGFDPVVLKANLTATQIATVAVRALNLPGVRVVALLHRHYPYDALFSHVVGYVGPVTATDLQDFHARNYVGRNYIGKSGLERYYERQIRGTMGYRIKDIDARGLQVGTLREVPAQPGDNLLTHLRLRVQQAGAEALQKDKGYRGAVVALDPNNGAVLAMITSPSFNANWFVDGISKAHWQSLLDNPERPLMNRADNGLYPPGSCAKPFYSIEAVQEGIIPPDFHTFCAGNYQLGGHTYWDWNRAGFGSTGLTKALAWSVDVFYYKLAVKMGIALQDKTLWRLGFGKTPPIDLPGGASGLVPTPAWKRKHLQAHWYTGDSVILGIGQGYLLETPLQLARAVAALANGGYLVQPQVAKALINQSTGQTEAIPHAQPVNLHISAAAMHAVHKGMEACVTTGTCHTISIPGITIAGKTGTAQVPVGYKNGHTVYNNDSLFIGWAPVHHPKIAVAVVVEYGGHNAWQALPVARAVIKAYLQPDEKTPEKVAEKPAAHYDAPLAIGEKGSVNPRPAHSMTP